MQRYALRQYLQMVLSTRSLSLSTNRDSLVHNFERCVLLVRSQAGWHRNGATLLCKPRRQPASWEGGGCCANAFCLCCRAWVLLGYIEFIFRLFCQVEYRMWSEPKVFAGACVWGDVCVRVYECEMFALHSAREIGSVCRAYVDVIWVYRFFLYIMCLILYPGSAVWM